MIPDDVPQEPEKPVPLPFGPAAPKPWDIPEEPKAAGGPVPAPPADVPAEPAGAPLKEFVIEGAKTSMPRTPEMKQAQTASNRAEKQTTARTFRTQRAGAEKQAREERLGKEPPPNLDDAHMVGAKDQERNDIRSLDDLSKLIDQYQNNLNRLLTRMQNTLIEAILHIETLENHWQRLK